MKRLYSLDFLKLVFAYVIAYFHFGHTIAPGPTVTVQIFFFISGFFLARKFYTHSHTDRGERYNQWNYTLDHAKGIFPYYVFSYAVFLLYNTARAVGVFIQAPSFQPIRETLLSLYDQIPNMLFMQSAFYFHDNMNYPAWQLSALVIGGYFVYGMLCWNEKRARHLLFPAAILMGLSLLRSGVELDANYGPIYIPLLRAFMGLSFGVLVYYFTTTSWHSQLKKNWRLFNFAVLLSLLCIFVYKDYGNIHYITGSLLILGCYDENTWINKLLNHRIFRHCGKLSLSIYLNHALVCRFANGFLFPRVTRLGLTQMHKDLIFFVLLTAASIAALCAVEILLKIRKKGLKV